jgi:hypothetical protein
MTANVTPIKASTKTNFYKVQTPNRISIEDRNKAHLQKLKEQRFEENLLKELEN